MMEEEEKPNKALIRFANFGVILGLVVIMIGIWGIAQKAEVFDANNLTYFMRSLFRLRFDLFDLFIGLILILQAIVINQNEYKKQLMIDKPWQVKLPDNVKRLYEELRMENERRYQENNEDKRK